MTRTNDVNWHERSSRRFFDRWSRNYEAKRISPWFRHTQQLAIDALDLRPDSTVLDVGCGTGYAVRRLAALLPQGRACGIDISLGMIEKSKELTQAHSQANIEFRVGSSSQIPYSDRSFTHLICTNSFHHYAEPLLALTEMHRVLVPGGQLALMENATDLSLYARLWDRLLRWFEDGHVRYYTSTELGDMLEAAGFVSRNLRVLRNEFLKHGKLFASIQVWRASKPVRNGPQSGLF